MKQFIIAIIVVVLAVVLFHLFSTHIHKDKTVTAVVNKAESIVKKS